MTPRIAVVDYGAGNLRSISRAIDVAGGEAFVASTGKDLLIADAIVLPGVGHAGAAMARMQELGIVDVLKHRVVDGAPFFGVCLGMQLLFGDQEEGGGTGLGILSGRVRALPSSVKAPQIGWNRAQFVKPGLLESDRREEDYYFVHSFVAEDVALDDIAAVTSYGGVFPSVVKHGVIWGTQFHPEKSSVAGIDLLRRWISIVPTSTKFAAKSVTS